MAAIHVAMGANYNATPSWGGHSQDDKALAEYKAALALDPTSGLANYYYGFGLQKLHKTAEARAAYLQASRVATGDVWTAAREALKTLPSNRYSAQIRRSDTLTTKTSDFAALKNDPFASA